MQAVILTAGESSRFWPFNDTHKYLVKIMGKPIILYTIKGLIDSGINDIIIIQRPNRDIETELKNYPEYSKHIKYVLQNEPKGMGNALNQAKDLLAEQFLLILAERVDCEEIIRKLGAQISASKSKAILVGATTDTPSLFGILKLENNKVIDIVEKPRKGEELSNIKALGVYVLTPTFLDIYQETKRHQYDFEEALSVYMKKYHVEVMLWNKETPSLKYPWHLFDMRKYLFDKYLKKDIGKNAKIAKSAEIIGNVLIGDNVSIMENVVIKGPCYIGDNVFVGNNAILRGGVNVEDNCIIGANIEIKNSLVMESSTNHSGFIGDSIIGQNCKIAGQFCTGNVRLDRKIVETEVKGEKVETGKKYLGAMIGSNTNIGIKSSTMPGVIIGRNVIIGPSTAVMKNIPDNTKYYTKFKEYVSKKMNKKPVVLFDIDYTLFDTALFKKSYLTRHKIYEEVRDVLEKLSKNALLGIFSEGDLEFQRKKLNQTGIVDYFEKDNTHIVLNKLTEVRKVLQKYVDRKTFFVDDKLSILFDAKKIFPKVVAIWVKRGVYAENQIDIPGFEPDAVVENLSEVVKIVKLKT